VDGGFCGVFLRVLAERRILYCTCVSWDSRTALVEVVVRVDTLEWRAKRDLSMRNRHAPTSQHLSVCLVDSAPVEAPVGAGKRDAGNSGTVSRPFTSVDDRGSCLFSTRHPLLFTEAQS
jgi:hypothetical protein